jgi:hypothetical protein
MLTSGGISESLEQRFVAQGRGGARAARTQQLVTPRAGKSQQGVKVIPPSPYFDKVNLRLDSLE